MAICPFAVQKLITPGVNDPRIRPTQAILHVAATSADSLLDYFRFRSGGIESHFYIKWDGTIEQYRDTAYEADANWLANPRAVSIETQGWANGTWNKRQIRSLKRLLLWLHETHPNIPLVPCTGPYGPGVGYHTMWGAPSEWTPVAKSCPGPNRIIQFNDELVPWMDSVTNPPAPPVRTTLSIVCANLWRENQHITDDLDVLAGTKAHLLGCQEAFLFTAPLRQVPGYQMVVGGREKDLRQTPILVRDDIQIIGRGHRVISDRVGPSPERGADYVLFEFAGQKRAHINTHMNSHVQQSATVPYNLPRVKEYIQGMRRVKKLIKELEAAGYKVTISGDLNWSWTVGKRQWAWAPRRVFKKLGYVAQFEDITDLPRPKGDPRRIEYILYRPEDLTILSQSFVLGEHSDHPWPLVTFVVKGL